MYHVERTHASGRRYDAAVDALLTAVDAVPLEDGGPSDEEEPAQEEAAAERAAEEAEEAEEEIGRAHV